MLNNRTLKPFHSQRNKTNKSHFGCVLTSGYEMMQFSLHKHDLLPNLQHSSQALHWQGQAASYSIFMNKVNVLWWAGLIFIETAWWTWTFPLSWFRTAPSVKSFCPSKRERFCDLWKRRWRGGRGEQTNQNKNNIKQQSHMSFYCCMKKKKLSVKAHVNLWRWPQRGQQLPPAVSGLRDEAQLRASEWRKIKLYQICSKRV